MLYSNSYEKLKVNIYKMANFKKWIDLINKNIHPLVYAYFLTYILIFFIEPRFTRFCFRFPFELVFSSLTLVIFSLMSFNIRLYVKHLGHEEKIKNILIYIIIPFGWKLFFVTIYVGVKFTREKFKCLQDYYLIFLYIGMIGIILSISGFFVYVNEYLEKTRLLGTNNLNGWERRIGIMNLKSHIVRVNWRTKSNIHWAKYALLIQLVYMLLYWRISIIEKPFNDLMLFDGSYYYSITAFIMLINYYLISSWRWFYFEAVFNSNHYENMFYIDKSVFQTKVSLNYCSFTRFKSALDDDEICTICLGNKPTTYFCLHHCFHMDCLIGLLYSKSEEIFKYSMDYYNYSSDTYSIRIKKEMLPNCPNCKQNLTDKNVYALKINKFTHVRVNVNDNTLRNETETV